MVAWYWLLAAFIGGGTFGFLLATMMILAGREDSLERDNEFGAAGSVTIQPNQEGEATARQQAPP